MFFFVRWSMLMTSLSITLNSATGALSGDQRVPTFESVTDKAILDHLLDTKRYDPRLRPDNHTVVNASIQLFSVASPDESSLNYEVEFLLHLEWRDRRLEFNDGGQHRYLKALTHANRIWVPDLYFIKHGELKQPLVDLSLKVLSDGTVIHITRRSMVINCQGNLKIFPFDNPKCPFAFESISHETTELELRWAESEPPLKKASSLQFHNAYLVKNATGVCSMKHTWRGNYSCLRVLLVFTRDKSFYFSTVFGPGMVLVTSSFISFWLDINVVPARVLIGVTTMLNFCTTTNNFRSKLPVVSNLTAMNLWDGVCMFFIYASLLEFVIGNYIHRKYPHLSRPTTEIQRKPSSVQSRRSRYLSGDSVPMHIVQPNATGPTAPEAKSEVTSPEGEAQSGEHTLNAEAAKEKDSRQEPADTQSRSPRFPIPFNTADCVVTLRRQAKSLDNVAKLVFPIIFGIFISCFFLTFAVIKPRQSENWDLIGEN